MSSLTKRNLIATLIIIAGLTASSLAWSYVPLALFPIIPLLGVFGVAVFLSLYPASPAPVQPAAARSPAARLATASAPPPGRRVRAREAPPRLAARGAERGAARGAGRRSGAQAAP